ncbi:MAG: hypothetical protein A2806_03280 [Candidatus Terrybacteria bacterium RIFCSPHIGHO2_01_FULL_48_17]|uniref:HTH crp-type domain-containing protein n=1 Tax=Candidatus Terrybacteria bacterium RIFCSPHIGHO2_01_FULL_48_17 TaxID=1802362 RepID=A0A1G2PGZ2_9BACT|nr:MAG: hypothetical protein A2806_03280 [Candidatus Terrybacteria bacterium RIFCSPHIGHO2_01_FULL_48_17]OHA53147.1 MAG: hypothetical protein A3A30_02180 [Candidatus Terrybacteria bacterium RIFCSPLOWO2_01_FULL_48_14]
MVRLEVVRSVVLLRDPPKDMLDALMHLAVEHICRDGESIFPRRPDLGIVSAKGRAFFVEEGALHFKITEQGRTITLATIRPGEIFADLAEQPPPGFFVAEGLTKLCIVSRKDLEAILAQHPEIALRTLKLVAQRLRDAEEKLADALAGDAASKVLRELTRVGTNQQSDGSVRLPYLTHDAIAQKVGLARETVTRIIARLVAAGKLERLPGRVGYLLKK